MIKSVLWLLFVTFGLSAQSLPPADRPVPRGDSNSQRAHQQLLEKARGGKIDLYFVGDSITRRWGATDYPEFLAHWTTNFFGWNAANFGWGSDRIEHVLWRLENGELDGVNPKVVVLLAGTNNASDVPTREQDLAEAVANLTRGLEASVSVIRRKAPGAVVVVMGIFPRNDKPGVMRLIRGVNHNLERLADGRSVRYLDVTPQLTDADGQLRQGVMAPDGVHPTLKGYGVWAAALKPILTEVLGPRRTEDQAPPATGDPSRSGSLPKSP